MAFVIFDHLNDKERDYSLVQSQAEKWADMNVRAAQRSTHEGDADSEISSNFFPVITDVCSSFWVNISISCFGAIDSESLCPVF